MLRFLTPAGRSMLLVTLVCYVGDTAGGWPVFQSLWIACLLASAVSGLATGGGFDVIGGLRNLAHLDRLAIGGDATTGSTL